MERKLKTLSVLTFAVVVILSTCSFGCKAKDDPDVLSNSSVSSAGQSEQQAPVSQTNEPDSTQQTPAPSSQQEPSIGNPDTSGGGSGGAGEFDSKIPNTIIVIIEEDEVFINGAEYNDANGLKNYIESINNDNRVFKLFENQAIQATHDWVLEVFRELQVEVMIIPNS